MVAARTELVRANVEKAMDDKRNTCIGWSWAGDTANKIGIVCGIEGHLFGLGEGTGSFKMSKRVQMCWCACQRANSEIGGCTR